MARDKEFYDLIFEKGYAMYDLERLCFWIGMPFWTIISALCGIAFFRTFPKKAAEKAGDISSSIFGYKFLIPASVLSLMALSYKNVIITAMLSIFMIVGYIVYRRGIRFRKSDLLIIVIGIIIAAGSAFN